MFFPWQAYLWSQRVATSVTSLWNSSTLSNHPPLISWSKYLDSSIGSGRFLTILYVKSPLILQNPVHITMVSNFQEKVRRYGEDTQPNVYEYVRARAAHFPFVDAPPGSDWTQSHLEWLLIHLTEDCELEHLFTKKSKLNTSGLPSQYLQTHLSLPWEKVITGNHGAGSLYDCLCTLASHETSKPEYQPEDVPPSSSPAESQFSEASPTPKARSTARDMSSFQSSMSGPMVRQSSRRSGQQRPDYGEESEDSSISSEDAKAHRDPTYQEELSSSPSNSPRQMIPGPKPKNKLEKDVERAATAFFYVMEEAYEATAASMGQEDRNEQNLTFKVAWVLHAIVSGFHSN